MKKSIYLAAALVVGMASSAFAVPYASQIKIDSTAGNVQPGTSVDISYYLNESADTVLIEILDENDAVVASFAGTATQGLNTVSWDTTEDNDGVSDVVDEGPEFKVRVTVDANKTAGWSFFAINQTSTIAADFYSQAPNDVLNPKNLFARYRPHGLIIGTNQELDTFGLILTTSSDDGTQASPHAAVVVLNSDLTIPQGSTAGLDSRVLRHPNENTPSNVAPIRPGFQDVWGIAEDPLNPGSYFVGGQGSIANGVSQLLYGTYPGNLADISATADLGAPRGIAVIENGGNREIFLAVTNNRIDRAAIDGSNQLVGPPVNILGIATPTLYSRAVFVDSLGNLYYVARQGEVHRWPASVVATATTAGSLTDSNRDWFVSGAGVVGAQNVVEMPNGDIVLAATGTAGSANPLRLYNLGNAASATPTSATVLTTDAFFEVTATLHSNYAAQAYADAFGNIYFANANNMFGIFGISPGGTTNTTVTAPLSQNFSIIEELRAGKWNLYN